MEYPIQKKRRLAGPEREKVKECLESKKPREWKRDEVEREMEYGDPEPPFLYSQEVIQKASHEVKYEKLGLIPGENIFDSFQRLKEGDCQLNKYMRGIGFDKFYVMYWSPEQVGVHNDIQTKLGNPMSLDSTGSIALKIRRPN